MTYFKKTSLVIGILMLGFTFQSFGQKQQIQLNLISGNRPLQLNSLSYSLNEKDSFKLSVLKFYISGIEFWKKDSLLFKEENSYHLIDASIASSLKIEIKMDTLLEFTKLKFNIGIDSNTTVSGAMSGALDPINGMYWTWQSGYIHAKIEGMVDLNGLLKEFVFHLGGYQFPFNTLQLVCLEVKSQEKLSIDFDVQSFLSQLNFIQQNQLMQPSKEAVILSSIFSKCFSSNQK